MSFNRQTKSATNVDCWIIALHTPVPGAGIAVGNRALIRGYAGVEAVDHPANTNGSVPVGGFSFSLRNLELKHAVDAALDEFLGSSAHRAMVAEFGLSDAEVDGALKTP